MSIISNQFEKDIFFNETQCETNFFNNSGVDKYHFCFSSFSVVVACLLACCPELPHCMYKKCTREYVKLFQFWECMKGLQQSPCYLPKTGEKLEWCIQKQKKYARKMSGMLFFPVRLFTRTNAFYLSCLLEQNHISSTSMYASHIIHTYVCTILCSLLLQQHFDVYRIKMHMRNANTVFSRRRWRPTKTWCREYDDMEKLLTPVRFVSGQK